jgi:hypothetical protein
MIRSATKLLTMAAVGCGIVACDGTLGLDPHDGMEVNYDFRTAGNGWVAGFTDYPIDGEEMMELESGLLPLPAPLDTTRAGFMLSAMNRSDDVFMYIRRQLGGLVPDADYDIAFQVQLATNAASGCFGIGGPPGEAVVVKTGASAVEPLRQQRHGDWRMNIDKGEQMEEGNTTLIVGHIGNSSDDCHEPPYELKDFDSAPRKLRVRTDAAGALWLFVGTESGFEGRTTVYITKVRARLDLVR